MPGFGENLYLLFKLCMDEQKCCSGVLSGLDLVEAPILLYCLYGRNERAHSKGSDYLMPFTANDSRSHLNKGRVITGVFIQAARHWLVWTVYRVSSVSTKVSSIYWVFFSGHICNR